MPTLTPHYSLYTYDSTTDEFRGFQEFRSNLAGITADSSMIKIDNALNNMQTEITNLLSKTFIFPISGIFVSGNNYDGINVDITGYSLNLLIVLSLDVTNAGSVYIQINSFGYKEVRKYNSLGNTVSLSSGDLKAGKEYIFRYDGSYFVLLNAPLANDIDVAGTTNNSISISSNNFLADSSYPIVGGTDAPADGKYVTTETNINLVNQIVVPSLSNRIPVYSTMNFSQPLPTLYDFDISHPFTFNTSPNDAGVGKLKSYFHLTDWGNREIRAYVNIPPQSGNFEARLGNCSVTTVGRPVLIVGLYIAGDSTSNIFANLINYPANNNPSSPSKLLWTYITPILDLTPPFVTDYYNDHYYGYRTRPITFRIAVGNDPYSGRSVDVSHSFDGLNFYYDEGPSVPYPISWNITKVGIFYTYKTTQSDHIIQTNTINPNNTTNYATFSCDYLALSV